MTLLVAGLTRWLFLFSNRWQRKTLSPAGCIAFESHANRVTGARKLKVTHTRGATCCGENHVCKVAVKYYTEGFVR